MNPLIEHRERLHLTQKELADESGISARTIQRIEAGDIPKGYTLKTLAKTLGVAEEELVDNKQTIAPAGPGNISLLKYINLISLPFIMLPPFNIVAPLVLMFYKKEWGSAAKQIISLQIIWLLASLLLFALGIVIRRLLDGYDAITIITMCVIVVVDLFIILRNAFALSKNQQLSIALPFNLL